MKKNILLTMLGIMYVLVSHAQTRPYYPFTSGNITNVECIENWKKAGSYTYQEDKYPYIILDANEDLGLKKNDKYSAASNSTLIEEAINNFKEIHPNEWQVIYFPAGAYYFNKTINLGHKNRLILKGESASTTCIVPYHPASGIWISNAEKIGIEDLCISRDTSVHQNPTTSWGESGGFNIGYSNAKECWVSGVYSWMAKKAHVYIEGGEDATSVQNVTITGCTFNDATAYGVGGEGSGVLFSGSELCLLENSLFHNLRHSINIQQNSRFNVIAYNASFDPHWDSFGWPSDLSFHGHVAVPTPPSYNLVEGNRVQLARFDKYHGSNGRYNLLYRTHINDDFELWECSRACDQAYQNVIGCTGVSCWDQDDIKGTYDFVGECSTEDGDGAACNNTCQVNWWDPFDIRIDYPNELDNDYKSYFRETRPHYMATDVWPMLAGVSGPQGLNGAERRKTWYPGFGTNTVDNETWEKYPCGPDLATHLFLGNYRNLVKSNYKALGDISATCMVSNTHPVTFTAPNSISLEPGFETATDATWSANIGTVYCNANRKASLVEDDATPYKPSMAVDDLSKQEVKEVVAFNTFTISPNVFSEGVKIQFSLKENYQTKLIVYNNLFQPVFMENQVYREGVHELNPTLDYLPAGVYIVSFIAGDYVKNQQIVKINH